MPETGESDFYVRERYIPTWRKANPFARALAFLSNVTRIALAVLCVGCAVLVLWPNGPYNEPISFQLARGNATAWGIMGTLAALLASSIPLLMARQRLGSIVICIAGIIGLALIATTDPWSMFHLFTFIWTCLALVGWLWTLAFLEEDSILFWAALGATLGGLICPVAMGVGERVVILSALLGIRGLFWGHLLE